MTVAASQNAFASESGSGGGVSGLASLAGLNLSSGAQVSPFQEFLLTLKSYELARRLSNQPNFLQKIFADRWDAKARRWKSTSSYSEAIDHIFGFYTNKQVGPGDVQGLLSKGLDIKEDKDSSAVTVRYKSADPQLSYFILKEATDEADQIVREASLERATEQARFIADRLPLITNLEHRQALVTLLSEYERKAFLSRSKLSYSIRVIDPATVPVNPSSPRPFLLIIAGAFLGALCSSIIIIMKNAKKWADQENKKIIESNLMSSDYRE